MAGRTRPSSRRAAGSCPAKGTEISMVCAGAARPAIARHRQLPCQVVHPLPAHAGPATRQTYHWSQPGYLLRHLPSRIRFPRRSWMRERRKERLARQAPATMGRRNLRPYQERTRKGLWLIRPRSLLLARSACVLCRSQLTPFRCDRYLLDEFVVMPNHVHALVKPLEGHTLSDIIHSWKSFTAKEICRLLDREGPILMDESFDHIVRSWSRLEHYRQYIRDNPSKAHLLGFGSSGRALPCEKRRASAPAKTQQVPSHGPRLRDAATAPSALRFRRNPHSTRARSQARAAVPPSRTARGDRPPLATTA